MRYARVLLCLNILIVVAFAVGMLVTAAVGSTVVQSIPTIRLGEANTAFSGGAVQLNVPLLLSNAGPLPISDLGGRANLNIDGSRLMEVKALNLNLPPGSTGALLVMATLNLTDADPALVSSMLFNDGNLTVDAVFGAAIAPLVSLSLSADGIYQWGAPLGDLQSGQPRLLAGQDGGAVIIPVSFRNRSTLIPLIGAADIQLLDQDGGEIGRFGIEVNAPIGSTFDGYLRGNFSIPPDISELAFNDRVLNCTLEMELWVQGFYGVKITRPYQLAWGAPIKDFRITAVEAVPKNATHSYLVMNFSFVDGSGFLPLLCTLGGHLSDMDGHNAGVLEDQAISLAPGEPFSGWLVGTVNNTALGEGLKLNICFETGIGTFYREEDLNA